MHHRGDKESYRTKTKTKAVHIDSIRKFIVSIVPGMLRGANGKAIALSLSRWYNQAPLLLRVGVGVAMGDASFIEKNYVTSNGGRDKPVVVIKSSWTFRWVIGVYCLQIRHLIWSTRSKSSIVIKKNWKAWKGSKM